MTTESAPMFIPINPIFAPALDLPAPERIHAEGGRATYECGRAHIKIRRDLAGGIHRMLRALNWRRGQ